MDVSSELCCRPHPLAGNLLFKYKRQAVSVFSDIVGIDEIDHVAIVCIGLSGEAIFLSYTPSLEYNLISTDLWMFDGVYTKQFLQMQRIQVWEHLYHAERYGELKYLKQIKNKFSYGVSISVQHNALHLVYSFATKSQEKARELHFCSMESTLVKMGNYCFSRLARLMLPMLMREIC